MNEQPTVSQGNDTPDESLIITLQATEGETEESFLNRLLDPIQDRFKSMDFPLVIKPLEPSTNDETLQADNWLAMGPVMFLALQRSNNKGFAVRKKRS